MDSYITKKKRLDKGDGDSYIKIANEGIKEHVEGRLGEKYGRFGENLRYSKMEINSLLSGKRGLERRDYHIIKKR